MNQRNQMKTTYLSVGLFAALFAFSGCGKTDASGSATEDSSTSGSVASAVGGAYNSSSGGTTAMNDSKMKLDAIDRLLASLNPISSANASTACTTFSSTDIATCLGANSSLSATYSDCSFGSSSATWTGGVSITCSGHDSVNREITNGTSRTNIYGSTITIKSTGSLETYSGSGATVTGTGTSFTSSGGNATLAISGINYVGAKSGTTYFDHTLTTGSTPLTLNTSTKELTGTVTTYHNLVKVTASSAVDVFFSSGCCTPTSGTITTTFTVNGLLGAKFNGTTETLTFTGCGSATYAGPDGTTGAVTLANCL